MTEPGTTDAGETQITGGPRVHVRQPLKLDGRGTTGSDIRLGQAKDLPQWEFAR